MTTATAPSSIYAQIRERAAKRQRAHDRKIFREACEQIAAHMDSLDFAELYKSELTTEINQSWSRIWDHLSPKREIAVIKFKVKGVTYWLNRYF
jgi:hypothetical protein